MARRLRASRGMVWELLRAEHNWNTSSVRKDSRSPRTIVPTTAPAVPTWSGIVSICIHRPVEGHIDKCRTCSEVDGEPGTLSGLAGECRNRVRVTTPAADTPTALLTHDEPVLS